MAVNSAVPKSSAGLRVIAKIFYVVPVLLVLLILGYFGWARLAGHAPAPHVMPATPFFKQAIGGLSAGLFTESGGLRGSGNDLFIEFRDPRGALVDVGNVEFRLSLSATNMIMHSLGKVLRTATPGQYRTTVEPQLAGAWTANLSYSGPRGKAETNFSISVSR